MPEESGCCPSEDGFPEPETCQSPQIAAHLQIPPAQTEGGEEPAGDQLQGDQKLAKYRQPPVEGAQKICSRSQEHPRQKTARQTGEDHTGTQRHSPRFRRGSP